MNCHLNRERGAFACSKSFLAMMLAVLIIMPYLFPLITLADSSGSLDSGIIDSATLRNDDEKKGCGRLWRL